MQTVLCFMRLGYDVQAHQRTFEASHFLDHWDQTSCTPDQLTETRIVFVGIKGITTRFVRLCIYCSGG